MAVLAAASVLVAVVLPSAGRAGLRINHADYRGYFDLGDLGRRGRVRISIVEGDGRDRHAKFEMKGLPVICDRGAGEESRDFFPTRVPFVNRKVFYSDEFYESLSGSIVLLVIKGKIGQEGRKASGYVRMVELRRDVESGDPEAGPDCATLDARQIWKAEATKRMGQQ